MSKSNRVRSGRLSDEVARLRAQNEELVRRLAAEQLNNKNASVFVSCLVKRLGAIIPNGIKMKWQVEGWRVIVTDEEVEAIEGTLEVKRNEAADATVLVLYRSEKEKEVDRERHSVDSGRS